MSFREFHFHHHPPNEAPEWMTALNQKLDLILANQEAIMASLDDVLKDVTDENSQLDGISTLISGLQQKVQDALANSSISPADQAKIDQVFQMAESNKKKILTALAANTPNGQTSGSQPSPAGSGSTTPASGSTPAA